MLSENQKSELRQLFEQYQQHVCYLGVFNEQGTNLFAISENKDLPLDALNYQQLMRQFDDQQQKLKCEQPPQKLCSFYAQFNNRSLLVVRHLDQYPTILFKESFSNVPLASHLQRKIERLLDK